MYTDDLQRAIVNWTVLHSGHIERRGYIGLSEMADCDLVIYQRYFNGQHFGLDEHLRVKLSYELELQLAERLRAMALYSPGEEICLYDGLVQGHTDGCVGADLLEIKTVPRQEYIPSNRQLPEKVYWQVQAYLHYTQRRYAHIIYLARDSGLVQALGVRRHEETGRKIELKLERIVAAVRECQAPACTCGHCKNGVTYNERKG
jgi:hypothetical protein